jgi:hypothetical protein
MDDTGFSICRSLAGGTFIGQVCEQSLASLSSPAFLRTFLRHLRGHGAQ